jgi:hypothetical protein
MLIVENKPDFILIAEPWLKFQDFPRTWLARLDLKLFAVNRTDNLIPNLWCLCTSNLDRNVIPIDDQQVTFTFCNNDKSFCISAIYASTCYLRRRLLWQKLSDLQLQYNLPWSYIGDFNTILGAHEHNGHATPSRPAIDDFQQWTDANQLIHLPTAGAFFTWTNGRDGVTHTERRLDRCICNQSWLDSCASIACSTLVRNRPDHYPLLLDFQCYSRKFMSSFKFLKMWSTHDNFIETIESSWNERIIGCPMFILNSKLKRLKVKLKLWNKEVFGNVHAAVKDVEHVLQNIQHQIHLTGHSDQLMHLEKVPQGNLDKALDRQDLFWQEKSKVTWHLQGDRNTAFFHRIAKKKKKTLLKLSLLSHVTMMSSLNLGKLLIMLWITSKLFFVLTLYCRTTLWWRM